MNAHKSEKGQALVLILISVVGLLGFAALAVDMGQLYAERRRAQSAADASALGAAYQVNAAEYDPVDVAYDLAYTNGFDDNQVDTWVEVYNPPLDGPYSCECGHDIDPNEYIQVKITRMMDPIFMQFLGRDFSMFTAEAVAHARPIDSISPGNAVHALSKDSDALEIKGNVDALIRNGNLRSNGGAVKRGGSGVVTVVDADIYTDTGWTNSTNVSPTPRHGDPVFVSIPPTPDCNISAGTVTTTGNGSHATTVLSPGLYASGIDINGGTVTMQPGMYCVQNGIQIRGNGSVTGDGIFIVLLSGEIRINGTSEVKWKRPNNLVDNSGNQWGGMLIYAPRPNTNEIYLTGTNGTNFMGTVFNPGGMCELGGNNLAIGLNAQVICDRINLHGNPDMSINYVDNQNYRNPPMVELTQ